SVKSTYALVSNMMVTGAAVSPEEAAVFKAIWNPLKSQLCCGSFYTIEFRPKSIYIEDVQSKRTAIKFMLFVETVLKL
ncbi:hypothetical protein A2U01_0090274, partial [Trifolium medium]|nr:hypothetical protein [Trifolium medium]